MFLHIGLLHLVSCLAGKNNEFAYHVLSRKVDAWVGLAIALLLGSAHSL